MHKLVGRGFSVTHPELTIQWFLTAGLILVLVFAILLPAVKLGSGYVGKFTSPYLGAPQTNVSLV